MSTNKVDIKEEMAIRHWQNVISFGTDSINEPKSHVQKYPKQVTFEVLP